MTGALIAPNLLVTWGSQCAIFHHGDSQIAHKIPNGGYPLSIVNRVLHCNETQLLLMKCSNAFSRCICIKEELLAASVCHLWVSLWCLPLGSTLSNCTKLPDVGYPISMANDMMYCNERHPLVMKCSNAFLRYKRQVGGPSDSICKALVGLIVPCSTEVDSQIASKLLDVGYPLIVWKIWWCTARRDNHCLWSVSLPYLDA